MTFVISGLPAERFRDLFVLDDASLSQAGAVRRTCDAQPGYPCRVSLEDAAIGEELILLHHESHSASTPYRSAYAIYVRNWSGPAPVYHDALPPVFLNRPIALRLFDTHGMLAGADIGVNEGLKAKIEQAFARPDVAYIHAHNAMHGCFVAAVHRDRAP